MMSGSWDIFCKVIDNFGDAGVCWRLARQLVAEHGRSVRLWIDERKALAGLAPGIHPEAEVQTVAGVEIRRWPEVWTGASPGAVVIEAFGCALPETLLAAMAQRSPPPVWINLEYLSAESWVEGSHRLPSRHPRLPLTKFFFFPGFTARTGGLLRERGLLGRRDAFLSDPNARTRFWQSLGLEAEPAGHKVSLFCYPEAPLAPLLDTWATGTQAVFCLVPEGTVAQACATCWGQNHLPAGSVVARGALRLLVFPFLPQDDYDRLLWACDLNFVRGEDSFVRAQWAGRPMIWQPYRQEGGTHLLKLDAFLALQAAFSPPAIGAMSRAWSGHGTVAEAWGQLLTQWPELEPGARRWARELARQPDLCRQLLDFAEKPDIMRGSPSS